MPDALRRGTLLAPMLVGAMILAGCASGPSPDDEGGGSGPTTRATADPGPPWIDEGLVFADTALVNVEVIPVQGGYRMFIHRYQEIVSAFSTDGRSFALEEGRRLAGEMPALVQLDDGRWRMYYKEPLSEGRAIRSAVSTDGFVFVLEEGDRLVPGGPGDPDAEGVLHPTVVRLDDGSYRMYYDGETTEEDGMFRWTILSASSLDGLAWTKEPGVRIRTGAEDPSSDVNMAWSAHVELDNGTFVLYFGAEVEPLSQSGIWRATSRDGLDFSWDSAPVIGRDAEYGNREVQGAGGPLGVPQDPFVLHLPDGTERLFHWKAEQGLFSAARGA